MPFQWYSSHLTITFSCFLCLFPHLSSKLLHHTTICVSSSCDTWPATPGGLHFRSPSPLASSMLIPGTHGCEGTPPSITPALCITTPASVGSPHITAPLQSPVLNTTIATDPHVQKAYVVVPYASPPLISNTATPLPLVKAHYNYQNLTLIVTTAAAPPILEGTSSRLLLFRIAFTAAAPPSSGSTLAIPSASPPVLIVTASAASIVSRGAPSPHPHALRLTTATAPRVHADT